MSLATFVYRSLRTLRSCSPSLALLGTLQHALCACCLACIILVTPVSAADVSLAWDASVSADVRGYRLYYGSASGTYTTVIDVGTQTAYTVTDVTGGQTYYFAATAYNAQGEESGFSNEVGYTIPSASGCENPGSGAGTGAPDADNAGPLGTPTTGGGSESPSSDAGAGASGAGNADTTGTSTAENTPPGAVNSTAALTVSLGEQTPTMDTLLTVSTHTEFLPVLHVRVDTGAEQVSLTEVTVAFSPSLDEPVSLDHIAVHLLHDDNGNGQVDVTESVLAMVSISDTSESLTLTLTTPLDLAPQTTTYLLVTLGGDSSGAGTRTTAPTRTGWLLLTPVVFGIVLVSWRRCSPARIWLPVLLLVCSVAFVSCENGHNENEDEDEAAVTLTLPAHSVRAEGALSGSLSGPTSPLVSPRIVVEQP